MGRYYAAAAGLPMLKRRMARDADIVAVPYGERFELGGVTLSFHPAGHCLGSAQVRVEGADDVVVAAGDYKRPVSPGTDPTCEPFEVVPCDTFITEATFALPIYRWDPPEDVATDIVDWWDANRAGPRERQKVSVIAAYSLGKAQRLLALLDRELARRGEARRRVFIHGALEHMIKGYRDQGVEMLPTFRVGESNRARGSVNPFRGHLVMAPPGAMAGPWIKRFGSAKDVDTAFASGWMRIRGVRRRAGYDRGFVISDHADWPSLVRTCVETGAKKVLCTHGNSETLARFLRRQGVDAEPLATAYGDEEDG